MCCSVSSKDGLQIPHQARGQGKLTAPASRDTDANGRTHNARLCENSPTGMSHRCRARKMADALGLLASARAQGAARPKKKKKQNKISIKTAARDAISLTLICSALRPPLNSKQPKSALLANTQRAMATLRKLCSLGVRIPFLSIQDYSEFDHSFIHGRRQCVPHQWNR